MVSGLFPERCWICDGYGGPFGQRRSVFQNHHAVVYSTGNYHALIICGACHGIKWKKWAAEATMAEPMAHFHGRNTQVVPLFDLLGAMRSCITLHLMHDVQRPLQRDLQDDTLSCFLRSRTICPDAALFAVPVKGWSRCTVPVSGRRLEITSLHGSRGFMSTFSHGHPPLSAPATERWPAQTATNTLSIVITWNRCIAPLFRARKPYSRALRVFDFGRQVVGNAK